MELVEERTEVSSTFATDQPGVFATELSSAPVHFLDGDGDWVDIDTDLVEQPDGRLEAAATAGEVSVAPDAADPALARVEAPEGAGAVEFGLEDAVAVPAEQTAPAEVVYQDVVGSVDVELVSGPTGVKETLVLESADDPTTFRFPLTIDGGLVGTIADDGGVVFTDPQEPSDPVLVVPPGWMADSSPDTLTGVSTGVTYTLETDADGAVTLVVDLDVGWLADPARVFPVRVDPTLQAFSASTDDTFVLSLLPTSDLSTRPDLGVGQTWYGKSRAYLHVPSVASVAGMTVHSATLNLSQSYGLSCAAPMEAYPVTQPWAGSTTTWSAQPTVGPRVSVRTPGFGGATCAATGTADVSVTTAVRRWADGTWANHGLMLAAQAETNMAHRRTFWSSNYYWWHTPTLLVMWSDPTAVGAPEVPTALSPDGSIPTITPTLSATYTDPDDDPGLVTYIVYDADTDEQVYAAIGSVVASGETSEADVPTGVLAWDHTYRLDALSVDDTDGDGPNPWDPDDHASPDVTTTFTTSSTVLSDPVDGHVVFATETVVAQPAAGGAGIASIDFTADGAGVGTDSSSADGWSVAWDTTTLPDGHHTLAAVVHFATGTSVVVPSVEVVVGNETSTTERILAARAQGELTADEAAVLGARSLMSSDDLPDRYHSSLGGTKSLPDLAAFVAEWSDLSPEARSSVIDSLSIGPGSGSPLNSIPASARARWTGCSETNDNAMDLGVLGTFAFCVYEVPDEILTGNEIRINFTVEDFDSDWGVSDVDSPTSGIVGVPDAIETMAENLRIAREVYEDKGFVLPQEITVDAQLDVVLTGMDLNISIPADAPLGLGHVIHISTGNAPFEEEPRHELFHIFQFNYLGAGDVGGYLGNAMGREFTPWWMEATAEWASHQVAEVTDGEDHGYSRNIDLFLADPTYSLGQFDPRNQFLARVPFGSSLIPVPVRFGVDGRSYGSFPVAEYLDSTVTDGVRKSFEEIAEPDQSDAMTAIDRVLVDAGTQMAAWLPEFWTATYLLSNDNAPSVPTFNDPDVTAWRYFDSDGASEFPESLSELAETQGDAFSPEPRAHRLVPDGVELTEADLSSGPFDVTLRPGGAAIMDVSLEDGYQGVVRPLIWVDDDQVAVGDANRLVGTWVAYDTRGYPNICVRDSEPVIISQGFVAAPISEPTATWEAPIELDAHCPTASIIITEVVPGANNPSDLDLHAELFGEELAPIDPGDLDEAFGLAMFPGYDRVVDVATQADGKVVVLLDRAADDVVAVARLTASGARDSTFGAGGIATLAVPVVGQVEGDPVAVGARGGPSGPEVVVASLGADFETAVVVLDDTGAVTTGSTLDALYQPVDMIIDNAGRPVLAGSLVGELGAFAARFTSAGIGLDTTFDGDGIIQRYGPGSMTGIGVAQVTGRYVLATIEGTGSASTWGLDLATGAPDLSYGTGGSLAHPASSLLSGIAAPPDGSRFLLRDRAWAPEYTRGYVAGFLPDGTSDPVWGPSHVPTGEQRWSADNVLANVLAVDSAGRAYLSDTDPEPVWLPRLVLRHTGNGPPDPSWPGGTGDLGFDVVLGAIQWPGGTEKLIVAGTIDSVPAIGRFDL